MKKKPDSIPRTHEEWRNALQGFQYDAEPLPGEIDGWWAAMQETEQKITEEKTGLLTRLTEWFDRYRVLAGAGLTLVFLAGILTGWHQLSLKNAVSKGAVVTVRSVSGSVSVRRGEMSVPVRLKTLIRQGDVIETSGGSEILMSGGSRFVVKIASSSRMQMVALTASESHFRLEEGKAYFKPSRQKPGEQFTVATAGGLQAAVRGTVFSVEAGSSRQERIAVTEGMVDVHMDEKVIALQPGEALKTVSATEVVTEPVSAADLASQSEIAAEPIAAYRNSARKILIKSEPSGAGVYLDGRLAGYTPYEASISHNFQAVELRLQGYESYALSFGKAREIRMDAVLTKTAVQSGQKIWSVELSSSPVRADISRSSLVVQLAAGLTLIDSNGVSVDIQDREAPFYSPPLLSREGVIFGSQKGGLVCYQKDGALGWSTAQAGKLWFTTEPAEVDGLYLLATMDLGLQIFGEGGKLLRRLGFEETGVIYSQPAFSMDRKLIFVAGERGVIASQLSDMKIVWKTGRLDEMVVQPLLASVDKVYVMPGKSGRLMVLNATTGETLKTISRPEWADLSQQPVISGSRVLVAHGSGLSALDTTSDMVVWNSRLAGIRSVTVDDRLVCVAASDRIRVYNLSDGKLLREFGGLNGVSWAALRDGYVYFLAGRELMTLSY